jgi:hypothetical protein
LSDTLQLLCRPLIGGDDFRLAIVAATSVRPLVFAV